MCKQVKCLTLLMERKHKLLQLPTIKLLKFNNKKLKLLLTRLSQLKPSKLLIHKLLPSQNNNLKLNSRFKPKHR